MARIVALLALFILLSALAVEASPSAAADCGFALGFRALRDLIPDLVGDCLENEAHNPLNGDALQRTTGGLLVWRKADNWTAFTNGSTTWINGPLGLQSRPNADRFAWEAAPDESGIEGQIVVGPVCPGPARLPLRSECADRPYQATVVVLDGQGREVARFQSDAAGHFRQPLPPGAYTLHPLSDRSPPFARDQLVTVISGQFTTLTISFDSGIR